MQYHYRVHRAGEVKCSQCGNSFKSSAKLTNHVSFTHSGTMSCDVCHKSFGHASSLQRHVKQEHDNVGNKVCQHCSKTFRADNLKIHIRSCKKNNIFNYLPHEDVEENDIEAMDENDFELEEKNVDIIHG